MRGVRHDRCNLRPLFQRQSARRIRRRPEPGMHGVCRKEWHYADLILNGEPEEYLKNTAGSRWLED